MVTFRVQRRLALAVCVLGLGLAISGPSASIPLAARSAGFPAQLTDKEFWELTEMISEPNVEFQSDNFLSNERGYQVAIPELIKTAAARGIKDFSKVLEGVASASPLKRNTDPAEVGDAAAAGRFAFDGCAVPPDLLSMKISANKAPPMTATRTAMPVWT